MTDSNKDEQKTSRKVNVKAMATIAVIGGLLIFTMTDNSVQEKKKQAVLTGNPVEAKSTDNSSSNNDQNKESTVNIEDNINNFDELAFVQILNEQDEIRSNIGHIDRRIEQFSQNIEAQEKKMESLVSSKLSPISSKLGDIEKNIQGMQDRITNQKAELAESYSGDGAFRFNEADAPNSDGKKKINTGNLKPVTSGYVSFNQNMVNVDLGGDILSDVSDELNPLDDGQKGQAKTGERTAGGVHQPQEDSRYYYTTINADSYVDAQLFHGIDCPIGAGVSVGSDGVGTIGPAPIIIKIKGMFKGANGEVNDIGDARIRGTCIGHRTSDDDYGRAIIKVERLTYSNADGEDFSIDGLGGYTIDARDEKHGVKGPIDKVLGSNIFAQSMAAFMSTVGMGFSSQQYDQAESGALGTTSQIFTGSVAKDMLGQGIGGMFNQIQQYWSGLMNSEVDRVMIPAGRSVRIVIDEAIVIKEPKSDIKSYAGSNDDLFF